jgi:hypothetical protein
VLLSTKTRYIVKTAERHRESARKRDECLERRLAEKNPPTQKKWLILLRFPKDMQGSIDQTRVRIPSSRPHKSSQIPIDQNLTLAFS